MTIYEYTFRVLKKNEERAQKELEKMSQDPSYIPTCPNCGDKMGGTALWTDEFLEVEYRCKKIACSPVVQRIVKRMPHECAREDHSPDTDRSAG